jgi:predicted dehydrogenase
MKLVIGIYGENGHQVQSLLENCTEAELVATAAFPKEKLPASLREKKSISHYSSLGDLLKDERVDLVSLCSPLRKDQAKDAIAALRAGKHVYAEKPCALTEEDLDEIIRVSKETGRVFREMAGTAFDQPYLTMRGIVRTGQLGEIVQITVEKSYPYTDARPQNEEIDGGLIGQNAIHGVRMIEHVAGVAVKSVSALETTSGNPVKGGGLRMASLLMLELANGGIASVAANYLNQRGSGVWGYEMLRIWGTKGLIESSRGGGQTRLILGEKDLGALDAGTPGENYFYHYLQSLLGKGKMPLTLEEELSPTRWVIRAKNGVTGCVNKGSE